MHSERVSCERDLIRFSIVPVRPFRLDLTVWALRRRPGNLVDGWDGESYQRVLAVGDKVTLVTVRQRGTLLDVTAAGEELLPSVKLTVTSVLHSLLGIKVDLSEFYEFAVRDKRLNPLADRFRGLKPPRFASVFESLVNGISCQQLSLTVGLIILNRLVERCGVSFRPGMHAFPRPEDLAALDPGDIRPLGYSGNKARDLIGLARAIAEGELDLNALDHLNNQECIEHLVAIRGVGRWTAEYALLRGLGRTDVFPGDDVGARNNLARWLGFRNSLDYNGVRRVMKKWNAYGGLIYLHLLLQSLQDAGHLQ
jgi:DNA-3-methyladenine glycosylase II